MDDKNTNQGQVTRDFFLTRIALKNRTTIFLLTGVLLFFGLYSYRSLPKELFPEAVFPYIMVTTIYPGNSPTDIENLITRPIEKEVENIRGVKKVTSNSAQDASLVFVEFNFGIDVDAALQDVKDAVDRARGDLPNDLLEEPTVADIDFSEFPVINVNLSGDYSLNELNSFAEYLEDEFEAIDEVSKVEIIGTMDREIQINADPAKMQMMEVSMDDIENAVKAENLNISGGEILMTDVRMSLRTVGEFTSVKQMGDIVVKNESQRIVYLRDVAEVKDGFAEPSSFARLDGKPVVSLQVVKKSGANLLSAIDKVYDVIDEGREKNLLPEQLNVTTTNDQSEMIRLQLSNLENNMLMGMILVILVLFYFLGTRNALFVGLAIPTSMLLSFVVISLMGMTVNMMVLFSLILALGMLVDNAIVAVENIHRFISEGKPPLEASRKAVSEIAMPIISSTATTLAAFFPLAFWPSIVGEFMKDLPITLIIVLTSSLFVALVIIPVFTATFIRPSDIERKPNRKRVLKIQAAFAVFAALFYLLGWNTMANILVLAVIITLLNIFFFSPMGAWFQRKGLPWLDDIYTATLQFALHGKRPFLFILGSFLLLIFTLFLFGVRQPKVLFFPDNEPQYLNILTTFPVGTDIEHTNALTLQMEQAIDSVLQPYRSILKSTLTTVGEGAIGENEMAAVGSIPHRNRVTVTFIDFEDRGGISTSEVHEKMSEALIGRYPGVQVAVEKNGMGPPAGKPVNIELSGPNYDQLILLVDEMRQFINEASVPGIEGLRMDLDVGKPELIVNIDREKARRFGLSTYSVASTLRTSLYGKEISDFKIGEDEYPIQLRLARESRYDLPSLLNQSITFRDNSTGQIRQVPISAVADISYSTTYDAVKRKNLDRVITLYSNVLEGYNANEINGRLKELLPSFNMPEGYKYEFTGEQEEQQESMFFLMKAMLIALSVILLILVSQFNSAVKPAIIMLSVVFSFIGVFGGLSTFRMDFVVIMTGIGIVSLAGIVVNNAIVLIDYIDLLKARRRKELGMEEDGLLTEEDSTACIVQAGRTRLRPVLLTAITTILGLITMAIGLNINFATLLSEFDPQLYFGGDMTAFWSPMSWAVIFGLTFSTFMTLVIVPCMYHLTYLLRVKMHQFRKVKQEAIAS
jgi:multidrug efflux pump subunit AcrB